MRAPSIWSVASIAGAAGLVLATSVCGSQAEPGGSGSGHASGDGASSSDPKSDISIDDPRCVDAVDIIASDYAPKGEDWRVTTPEEATPLVNARSITGGIVFWGHGVDTLPEFPCLESIDTIWVEDTTLTNLSAFGRLAHVTEYFKIARNDRLDDLTGLETLESAGRLSVSSNPGLRSLAGLDSLQKVDGNFSVTSNPDLVNLAGMPAVEAAVILVSGTIHHLEALANTSAAGYVITSDGSLTSLDGLPVRSQMDLVNVGGGSFDSLGPLANLEEVGFLSIGDTTELQSLDGLQNLKLIHGEDEGNGTLYLAANEKLTDITALSNVTIVKTTIEIKNNPLLTSLAGLENVASTEYLAIRANSELRDLDPLLNGALESVGQWMRITTNPMLPECQALSLCAKYPDAECIVLNNDTDSMDGC